MRDEPRYLARVRTLALAAMATAEGKPLYVAAGSASPPPAASLPRHSLRHSAGVAGGHLSPSERRRLAHLSPAAIAAVDRVVAKLSDRTAETRHAVEPGQDRVHFRRRQKTLAVGR